MFIDTHTHLYSDAFDTDRDQVVKTALQQGIHSFVLPCIDAASIPKIHSLYEQYPAHMFPTLGLHPCSVKKGFEQELEIIEQYLQKKAYPYCAIGEIGIDLYWDKSTLDIQIRAFEIQIEWAKQHKLPIIIHVRDAFDPLFEVLDRVHSAELKGVFHCFSGTLQQAQRALEYGNFVLGVGGVITFKNAGLDSVFAEVPLAHLVLETDSPYLAPTPHRGKRNESGYVLNIAQKLAQIKNIALNEVAQATTKNAVQLFNL